MGANRYGIATCNTGGRMHAFHQLWERMKLSLENTHSTFDFFVLTRTNVESGSRSCRRHYANDSLKDKCNASFTQTVMDELGWLRDSLQERLVHADISLDPIGCNTHPFSTSSCCKNKTHTYTHSQEHLWGPPASYFWASECFERVRVRETVIGRAYDWVLRMRPDSYLHFGLVQQMVDTHRLTVAHSVYLGQCTIGAHATDLDDITCDDYVAGTRKSCHLAFRAYPKCCLVMMQHDFFWMVQRRCAAALYELVRDAANLDSGCRTKHPDVNFMRWTKNQSTMRHEQSNSTREMAFFHFSGHIWNIKISSGVVLRNVTPPCASASIYWILQICCRKKEIR